MRKAMRIVGRLLAIACVAVALAVISYVMSTMLVPAITDVYELSTALWARIIFAFFEFVTPAVLFVAAKMRYGGSGRTKPEYSAPGAEIPDIAGKEGERRRTGNENVR